ncbi:MAG: hypothetical protein HY791_23865 [Deltaproteobacteria bacterium]|nr:hypothetical protein [Deltaproteobacteria bacterium]
MAFLSGLGYVLWALVSDFAERAREMIRVQARRVGRRSAVVVVAASLGCEPVTLSLPELDGAESIVLGHSGGGNAYAIAAPADGALFRVDIDRSEPGVLTILAYRLSLGALGLTAGPVLSSTRECVLGAPQATFLAAIEAGQVSPFVRSEAQPPSWLMGLLVEDFASRCDRCLKFEAHFITMRGSDSPIYNTQSLAPLASGAVLVGFPDGLFRVSSDSSTRIAGCSSSGYRALAAASGSNRIYGASSSNRVDVLSIDEDAGTCEVIANLAMTTDVAVHRERLLWIATSADHEELFVLSSTGSLDRRDTAGWRHLADLSLNRNDQYDYEHGGGHGTANGGVAWISPETVIASAGSSRVVRWTPSNLESFEVGSSEEGVFALTWVEGVGVPVSTQLGSYFLIGEQGVTPLPKEGATLRSGSRVMFSYGEGRFLAVSGSGLDQWVEGRGFCPEANIPGGNSYPRLATVTARNEIVVADFIDGAARSVPATALWLRPMTAR